MGLWDPRWDPQKNRLPGGDSANGRGTPRIWRRKAQGHCELYEHPKVVQEMLGHASITLTMDTYSHVLPGMQEESAARLNELLEGR